MTDPSTSLTQLLGALPQLVDIATTSWDTAFREASDLVERTATDVVQIVQGGNFADPDSNQLGAEPMTFRWRRRTT